MQSKRQVVFDTYFSAAGTDGYKTGSGSVLMFPAGKMRQ